MTVYKLTEGQAESLRDQIRPDGSKYNVDVKDADGNIIISEQQYVDCLIGVPIPYNPKVLDSEE